MLLIEHEVNAAMWGWNLQSKPDACKVLQTYAYILCLLVCLLIYIDIYFFSYVLYTFVIYIYIYIYIKIEVCICTGSVRTQEGQPACTSTLA